MVTKKTTPKKSEPKKKKPAIKAEKVAVAPGKIIPSEEVAVKEVKEVKKVKEETLNLGKYFYAVGRRKSSIAQVRLFVSDGKENEIKVNDKDSSIYFSLLRFQTTLVAPLLGVASHKKFFVSVHVQGGGIMGQAEAIRLGISRALVKFDENLKKPLKDLGFLTRDARIVERKKPGRRKARRSPQWAKR